MAEPVSRFISVGDLNLHLLDWGGDSGRVLLFVHGLASSAHMFDLIAADFTDRYHVYAVDQRGHGLSDKPSSGYDFETLAVDLDRLLAAINPDGAPVALVGHSWGAAVALYYAATRSVDRLVLLDGGVRPLTDVYPTWNLAETGMAPPVYQNRSLAEIEDMIEHRWLGAIYRPELKPLVLSIYDTGNPTDVRARLSRVNHMLIAHELWAFQPGDYFARVQVPTLIVVAVPSGTEMPAFIRRRLDEAEALLLNGRVVVMEETIHDIPWHRPRELSALLTEFLSSL